VYINGNKNFAGRRLLLDRKKTPNFEILMDFLAATLTPKFGAVHRIVEWPTEQELHDISELRNEMNVVIVGRKPLVALNYLNIKDYKQKEMEYTAPVSNAAAWPPSCPLVCSSSCLAALELMLELMCMCVYVCVCMCMCVFVYVRTRARCVCVFANVCQCDSVYSRAGRAIGNTYIFQPTAFASGPWFPSVLIVRAASIAVPTAAPFLAGSDAHKAGRYNFSHRVQGI